MRKRLVDISFLRLFGGFRFISGERLMQRVEAEGASDAVRVTFFAAAGDRFFFGENLWVVVIMEERDAVLASAGVTVQPHTTRTQTKRPEKRLMRLMREMNKDDVI